MATKKTTDPLDAMQEAMDAEHERGHRGVAVDPTPNENYTLAGVTKGKPTPETDPDHREKVKADISKRAAERF